MPDHRLWYLVNYDALTIRPVRVESADERDVVCGGTKLLRSFSVGCYRPTYAEARTALIAELTRRESEMRESLRLASLALHHAKCLPTEASHA